MFFRKGKQIWTKKLQGEKMPPKETAKTATQTFKLKAPKKHSNLFENSGPDPLFTGVYLMKTAATKLLGVEADKITEIEVTVKAV
jgi:hypothetical protein